MTYPYTGYQPYYQPTYQQYQPQTAQAPSTDILWVQGEAGAKSYLVGAGHAALLMDSEAERFYIKTSDASGVPQPLRTFEYKEITAGATASQVGTAMPQGDYVTRAEYEALTARVDALGKEGRNESSV